MPLTAQEVQDLTPDALEIANDILCAFSKTSPGGKRLTKKEARQLGWKMLKFGVRLIGDIVD